MYVEILILTVLINNVKTENIKICKECVAKCCPTNQYVLDGECEPNNSDVPDFSTIGHYDSNITRIGNLNDFFTIVTKPVFKEPDALDGDGFISKGVFVLDTGDDYSSINNTNYCVDFFAEADNTTIQIKFWFVVVDSPPVIWDRTWMYLKLAALFTSGFFLLLVMLAYLLVEKLRDLKGKIRLAFVTNLFGLYITLACVQILFKYDLNSPVTDHTCQLFTTIIYYFYWASCCWMNVSIYDIWVSLSGIRSVAVNQPQYWNRDRRTFLKFCAYSFVIPCVLALSFTMLHFLKDKSKIINIIISNGECSLEKTTNTNYFYFLYITMILINLITFVLYVRIARYLWIRKRQTRRQLKHVNRKEQYMGLIMHIKIWTLTGMTWLLDAITIYLTTASKIWDLLETIHLSSGIGLFIIIICNRHTLHLIYERFKKVQH